MEASPMTPLEGVGKKDRKNAEKKKVPITRSGNGQALKKSGNVGQVKIGGEKSGEREKSRQTQTRLQGKWRPQQGAKAEEKRGELWENVSRVEKSNRAQQNVITSSRAVNTWGKKKKKKTTHPKKKKKKKKKKKNNKHTQITKTTTTKETKLEVRLGKEGFLVS